MIGNLSWFGYAGASWIRRAKLGREGFGAVDLLLLPPSGRHRLVLVEVKHQDSHDTPGRVVGQLLSYYLASLRLGSEGLARLQQFAETPRAHNTSHKSLQMLSGLGPGSRGQDLEALRAGQKLSPKEIGLIVAIGRDDGSVDRRESFLDLRAYLKKHGGIDIRVTIARPDGSFEAA